MKIDQLKEAQGRVSPAGGPTGAGMTHPWPRGTAVRTTALSERDESWIGDYHAGKGCRWGVPGTIEQAYLHHGLYYEVSHLDGTLAYYAPSELLFVADLSIGATIDHFGLLRRGERHSATDLARDAVYDLAQALVASGCTDGMAEVDRLVEHFRTDLVGALCAKANNI
jgi:hypothetical protein